MEHVIFEKLKASNAVLKLRGDQVFYILTNADGHERPKLYSFVHHNGKPVVSEITEEDVMRQIADEQDSE